LIDFPRMIQTFEGIDRITGDRITLQIEFQGNENLLFQLIKNRGVITDNVSYSLTELFNLKSELENISKKIDIILGKLEN